MIQNIFSSVKLLTSSQILCTLNESLKQKVYYKKIFLFIRFYSYEFCQQYCLVIRVAII